MERSFLFLFVITLKLINCQNNIWEVTTYYEGSACDQTRIVGESYSLVQSCNQQDCRLTNTQSNQSFSLSCQFLQPTAPNGAVSFTMSTNDQECELNPTKVC
jgi:hypothetical protein